MRTGTLVLIVVSGVLLLGGCFGRKNLGDGFELITMSAGERTIWDVTEIVGGDLVDAHVSRVAYDKRHIVGLKVRPKGTSKFPDQQKEYDSNNGFFIISKAVRSAELGMEEDVFLAECQEQEIHICDEVLEDDRGAYGRVVDFIAWIRDVLS